METILTDNEIDVLIYALGKSRGERGFSEKDIIILCDWATEIKVQAAAFQLISAGTVLVDVVDGEVVFQTTNHATCAT